jgi:WD40 repeat protein
VAIGTQSGDVHILDIERPNEPLMSLKDHDLEVTSVAFSSDGKRLFTCSRDFTVRVWDMTELTTSAQTVSNRETRSMLTLEQHDGEVTSVSFSPAAPDSGFGPFLLSTGLDGQAILWPSAAPTEGGTDTPVAP